MDVCRICLKSNSEKDIFESIIKKNDEKLFLVDVLMFCFDIKVVQDSNTSSKLCTKCYKKVLSFHEFKCLALKNDAHLKSKQEDGVIKNEVFIEAEIKYEELSESDDSQGASMSNELNNELCLKNGDSTNDYDTDDELLSVIKKIKYEYVEHEIESKEKARKTNSKKRTKTTSKVEKNKSQMCEECGKTVKDLKAHSYLHQPIANRKRISCKVCDKTFSSHSARYKHNKIKHLGVKQKCTLCNKVVTSINQHHRVVHNRASLKHECVPCGRRFISKSSLDVHMTTHTKDRPFACPECDKKFSTNAFMLIHKRRVHDKERSHLCQLCSKSFFKKYHLQIHLRSHSKEKPYECPDCGKFFSTTSILKSHRELHREGKTHACTLCDMTFKKRGYLNVHMISHTKEKRHACQYCGIKFGRSDHRKRHEFTAHEKHLIST